MIKVTLIVGFIFFIPFSIKAQSTLPPVYDITSDTAYLQMVDSTFWQKLEDIEGKWTFEEVTKEPLAGKFHIKGKKTDGVDTNDVRTYWHRYRFKNVMPQDAKISLTSPADFFDIYVIKQDSSVVHYRSGFLRDWDEKDGLKSAELAGAVPLVIKPGEIITVYDRRNKKNETNFRTSVRFLSTRKLEEEYINYVDSRDTIYSKLQLQEAFMLGLLFLSTVFSIFLFRVTREKVYIYFVLFTFFLAINRHWNIVNVYTSWYLPAWNRYVVLIGYAWIFIPFFLVLFIRNFFDSKQRFPRWNKVLITIGWLQLTIGVLDFILRMFTRDSGNMVYPINVFVVFLIVPLALFVTSLLYLNSRVQSYRFVAMGALPYMLFYITGSLVGPETVFWDNSSLSVSKWLGENFRLLEMITLAWLIVCFTWVLFMRFDQLRKENIQQALDKERLAKEREMERNELIAKQKTELEKEVAGRTADLKNSLENLRSAQAQLIQTEKMASLGELTAGIAHEIQNPLNFVNNFSEVSNELIDEMNEELNKGDLEEAKIISADIKQSLEKINHHGKRADAIVKGMLQHSRSSSGVKESTDINRLCDEYLRLAYHGLRAKDKSFNATMKTDFDESIGNINIIPQDVGRVILNLINNAFYAVDEKKKQTGDGYEPTVSVSTKKEGNKVLIMVKDNGNGIPQKVLDKIFQPFFTTKPAGQGTGLGLSLSYDIVKAHGGEIKVNTSENEGTEFTISLPA